MTGWVTPAERSKVAYYHECSETTRRRERGPQGRSLKDEGGTRVTRCFVLILSFLCYILSPGYLQLLPL